MTTAPAATDATATSSARPSTYTVVSGDTLWDLSHKFNCSVSSLKKLNKLKKNNLKPGQLLKIPPARATKTKPTASSESRPSGKMARKSHSTIDALTAPKVATHTHHHANTLVAQPVQDFDIPASTFASCPAPPSNGSDAPVDEIAPASAPIGAEASSPAEIAPVPVPPTDHHATSSVIDQDLAAKSTVTPDDAVPVATAPKAATPPKSFASKLADFFAGSHANASESGEWGNRFLTETRNLASQGIGYDESWRPEGESHSWDMDCSNTTRYLYQVTAGIQLPRTASDQYYYLHLQNKAWDVPTVASGFADCNFLRSNLKPGDLLFWENTYRPDRQPPITHVMIFLGTNAKGQWLMAGSQSSHGGLYSPRRSGPDVYVFNPTRPTGGYTTWLGLVHHQGRFCAYGRPLEADVKKLSIAAND
jgi:cell wall-associated NlpC family hydrolase